MTAAWGDAHHRTKVRAEEGDLMNAVLRGRGRVDAADQPEPAPVVALHPTKEDAAHDQMNAFLRGRRRVDAADHAAEPAPVAAVDFEGGVRGLPSPPPPPDMSVVLRADLGARRRQRQDYQ